MKNIYLLILTVLTLGLTACTQNHKSTYFGLFGYGIFGKQADEKVQIDQKSLDLVNRWKTERLAKFQFLNADCSQVKVKP